MHSHNSSSRYKSVGISHIQAQRIETGESKPYNLYRVLNDTFRYSATWHSACKLKLQGPPPLLYNYCKQSKQEAREHEAGE